jgi:hypothetical protein
MTNSYPVSACHSVRYATAMFCLHKCHVSKDLGTWDLEEVDGHVWHQNYPIRYIPRTCLYVCQGRCVQGINIFSVLSWHTQQKKRADLPAPKHRFARSHFTYLNLPAALSTCQHEKPVFQTSLWTIKAGGWQGHLKVVSSQKKMRLPSIVNRLQDGKFGV